MMKQLEFFRDFIGEVVGSSNGKRVLDVGIKSRSDFHQLEELEHRGFQIKVKRRPYQRHLSVRVKTSCLLHVTAARYVTHRMLLKFLDDNWSWVQDQVQRLEVIRLRFPTKMYVPGEVFSILGSDKTLDVRWGDVRSAHVVEQGGSLSITLPKIYLSKTKQENQRQIKKSIRDFYHELGRKILSERVYVYSQKLQLFPQAVSYRCQRTRWGSCTSSGKISLNWRLAAAPLEVIDYVVIHELCHLKHQNHSQHFWKLVETQSPRWKKLRLWLNENQYAFDFLTADFEE